jgi:molybdopterin-containing oxidoreductase family iron-sulfur binding subunit
MKRRDAIKLIGLSGGLAAWGSSPPFTDQVIPYLKEPKDVIPGLATWYATTCRECPAGCGMWVKTREGRPIKVEGNPSHPINRGGLCARGQASLQGLYHPNRFRGPMVRKNGELKPISWDEGIKRLAGVISDLRQKGKSDRIAFVTGAVTGTLAGLMDKWLAALGAPQRITYEPLGRNPEREANKICFGLGEIPALQIDRAEFLVTFSSDLIETGPSPVEHARQLAEARSRWGKGPKRFFAFSPRLDLTAANADEWIPLRPGNEGLVVMAIIHALVSQGLVPAPARAIGREFSPDQVAQATGIKPEQIQAVAKGLAAHRPGLVIGGPFLDVETGKAINLLNALLGNVNRTIRFGTGTGADWATDAEMNTLAGRIGRGEVELLLAAGAQESGWMAEAWQQAPLKVAFATLPNPMTEVAELILPIPHFLEAWDDYSPRAGMVGLVQPARRPLYDTRHLGDILLEAGKPLLPEASFEEARDRFWQGQGANWVEVRQRGGSYQEAPEVKAELKPEAFSISLKPLESRKDSLTLAVFSSTLAYDGRGRDRPWLRECPDPMSKITWEGWAELHPETAAGLRVKSGDLVKIEGTAKSLELPVWITPGIHPQVIAVPLGVNWGVCRPPENSCAVRLKPTGQFRQLALAQGSEVQLERGLARDTEYQEAHEDRRKWEAEHQVRQLKRPDMYPEHEHARHRWGMAIDLDRCTGCSACVVACYAENNLPVVGRDLILNRREMSWIRIERYYEERGGMVKALFVPMLCQHCDHAPCETVCPVFATYHTAEGLNAQIYNRCVGTRYCSNNCPYKVRRFNWFTYEWPEPLNQQLNPEVTVREKGVMEKCTFCIQRIMAAKMKAKLEGRQVQDGEIVPACAQTCPTGAIVFGDWKDPASRLAQLAKSERAYRVFEELNTRPAITYLKRVARKG